MSKIEITKTTGGLDGDYVNLPQPATDNAVARYDGTAGEIQNSALSIDDELSSSTQLDHINSGASVVFNLEGANDIYLSNTRDISESYMYIADGEGNIGSYSATNAYGGTFSFRNPDSIDGFTNIFINADDSGTVERPLLFFQDNRIANRSTLDKDTYVGLMCARNATGNSGVVNAVGSGGDTLVVDTDNVHHTQTSSVKVNDLGSVGTNQTLTISDGAHIKLTPTDNITINVNLYTNSGGIASNSVRWTLEVDNAGGHTITQGTGFVNDSGGAWTAFGTGLEVLTFDTLSDATSLLQNQKTLVS